ncbi:hypothetical protein DC522_05860 [Microvirga sp. KLBC 81]|uniref:hypothetical protein n=1 Tax=Microvirga sp. KLBC 81 TaxID=1862707 RepID=UPI000D51BA8B|nr:hypothetical protein [Microvirga sp. KLBC 81]PVE25419.1 hypothetical protein DC522_05860 [Microvirga sp. KLBC 81]
MAKTELPKLNTPGRTVLAIPKVRRFLDLMVEGQKLVDAADAVGLKRKRARLILRDPAVRKQFFQEIEELRESERARNILLAVSIRDEGMTADATAASKKVALEAARYLDGDKEQGGITINGGQNVIAGYVINLDGPSEGPKLISSQRQDDAKPLINREGVTDV